MKFKILYFIFIFRSLELHSLDDKKNENHLLRNDNKETRENLHFDEHFKNILKGKTEKNEEKQFEKKEAHVFENLFKKFQNLKVIDFENTKKNIKKDRFLIEFQHLKSAENQKRRKKKKLGQPKRDSSEENLEERVAKNFTKPGGPQFKSVIEEVREKNEKESKPTKHDKLIPDEIEKDNGKEFMIFKTDNNSKKFKEATKDLLGFKIKFKIDNIN